MKWGSEGAYKCRRFVRFRIPYVEFFPGRLLRNDITILNICSCKRGMLLGDFRQAARIRRELIANSQIFRHFPPEQANRQRFAHTSFVIGIPVLLLCHATALLLLLLLLLLSLLLFLRSTHVLHINRGEGLKRKKGGMFTAL